MRKLMLLMAVLAFAPISSHAEERATTKEAEQMVHSAVAFYKKEGREKALAAFSELNGPFAYRDLYIVALDPKAIVKAHGTNHGLIEKSTWDLKDPDGVFFAREMVTKGKSQGKGWQEYKYQNPATKKIEFKIAYFELVDDLVLLCGAYREK